MNYTQMVPFASPAPFLAPPRASVSLETRRRPPRQKQQKDKKQKKQEAGRVVEDVITPVPSSAQPSKQRFYEDDDDYDYDYDDVSFEEFEKDAPTDPKSTRTAEKQKVSTGVQKMEQVTMIICKHIFRRRPSRKWLAYKTRSPSPPLLQRGQPSALP